MKVTRLGLSLCYAFHSLVLFYVIVGLHEIAHEYLGDKPLPAVAEFSHVIEPIGVLLIIFPVLVGFASWRCPYPVSPSFQLILAHILFLGFSTAAFIGVMLATTSLTHMNGTQPVSVLRIVGNILMGVGLISVILRSYLRPKRTEQGEDTKPDNVPS